MQALKVILFLFFAFYSCAVSAQTLKTSNFTLNTGGAIYDVAYDSYYNAYIVVGNFTTINGQARNNLAFINADDFTVMTQAPISSIDGEIRSVEIMNNHPVFHPVLGSGDRQFLYIGGNFTNINGNTRVNVARLSATLYFGSPPVNGLADYGLNTWDLEIINQFVPEYGVNDLHLSNDTLVIGGEFIIFAPSHGLVNDIYNVILTNVFSIY